MPEKFTLSLDSTVTRNAVVIDAQIDGEVVAMNVVTGYCYGLNSVGSRIWQILESSVRVSGVCGQLNAEFEVEPETCERQVLGLLKEMHAEDLIKILENE